MARLIRAGRVAVTGNTISYVRFLDDFPAFPLTNLWDDTQSGSAMDKVYVVQTNTKVVERCLLMSSDPGDLVLDPTCGSGTTAFVAEEWGRRWITIDTSRVSLSLARARLMAGRFPYYVLADTVEGDVSKGFAYRSVPHVTLKSITTNPEIADGTTGEEVDRAIRRHTERETLLDQPQVDSKVVRVSGPFTVESLSPHRIVDASDRVDVLAESPNASFEQVILDNLRAAGVQNTERHQRLVFDSLEPWSGVYVNAVGEYSEKGSTKRAAICIGPEHGTVGVDLVREAAKEAARFFDMLIICGFAFEARVGEEASHMGRLTILRAAMNPDLAMGGDLLKKTGSANLFGEPDIEIRRLPEEKIQVEIRGLDVYDPTTGEIRSHSTADIACWFVDTDYNDESFFVRHAYFLGAGDPYEQLKRALRADIDEVVWSSLYSTVSRPFPQPTTGKIAVKVINHYGDEVMKVYSVTERRTL
jgi:adenine-specific DNA-methyltransferase